MLTNTGFKLLRYLREGADTKLILLLSCPRHLKELYKLCSRNINCPFSLFFFFLQPWRDFWEVSRRILAHKEREHFAWPHSFHSQAELGEASALGLESWPEDAVGVVSVPKWRCDCCFFCSSWKRVQKMHPAWDKDIRWGCVCSAGPESLDEDTRSPSVPPEGSFRLQPPLVAGRLNSHECGGTQISASGCGK